MTTYQKLQKLIRPDSQHITRFHTIRGSLIPLKAWATVPSSIRGRLTWRSSMEPWMTRPAILLLDALIEPTWKVLELGSGRSTIWLSKRCQTLTSLETNRYWKEHIADLLRAEGLHNCTLQLRPGELFPSEIAAYPDWSFDLIIVDCSEEEGASRVRCLESSMSKVKPAGCLVLDDSDREEYRVADSILADWEMRRIVGLKPYPFHATETSFYRKPGEIEQAISR